MVTKAKSHHWINVYLISSYLLCIDLSCPEGSVCVDAHVPLVPRTAACSVPRVRQSTERRRALSPKERWKFTASASRCPAIQTVEPSRSSTAFLLEYRSVHFTEFLSCTVHHQHLAQWVDRGPVRQPSTLNNPCNISWLPSALEQL